MEINKPSLNSKLNSIRQAMDVDVCGVDIDSIQEQGKRLSALIGLSAECKAEARKKLDAALLIAINSLDSKKYSPSVLLKIASAMCADEASVYEYADRLNAGITHQLDYFRTLISLHKEELSTSLRHV